MLLGPVTDHPRIRGEHCPFPKALLPWTGSSPHTRGARPCRVRQGGPGGIIPAYAGSTGDRGRFAGGVSDHPRIRGEHEKHHPRDKVLVGSSPHTRGAPNICASVCDSPGDHPRIRGEHQRQIDHRPSKRGSSPHTRGAPTRPTRGICPGRIIPAYAGSTPSGPSGRGPGPDHPRIRGEHAITPIEQGPLLGSSPHTRGARPGIPKAVCSSTDHPRIRGEHFWTFSRLLGGDGSSPHTRGARSLGGAQKPFLRIIPAYAGSTNYNATTLRGDGDHPRIRGEHPSTRRGTTSRGGSSPHTRGAHDSLFGTEPGIGIIPAYAGSTTSCRSRCRSRPDHPRIRGEHYLGVQPASGGGGSSPHTRGARRPVDPRPREGRIIPAYAGSTAWPAESWRRRPDHPRIRGEHNSCRSPSMVLTGSSPHTRGAQRCLLPPHDARRIIPAYAGSTSSCRQARRL